MNLFPLRPCPSSPVTYPPMLRRLSDRLERHMQGQGDSMEVIRVIDGGCRLSLDRESTNPDVLLIIHVLPRGLEIRVQVGGIEAGRMTPPLGLPWSRLVPLMLGMAGWDYRPPN